MAGPLINITPRWPSSLLCRLLVFFFFSSRRRHTRYWRDWSSDVCSSDLLQIDSFVAFVLRVQLASYMLLWLWTIVLQVMGFSEILGLTTRKAFGVWVLGQIGRASCRERV